MPPLPTSNAILRALPEEELSLLTRLLERQHFEHGRTLVEPNDRPVSLVFPAGAVLSVVAESADGPSVEVSTIGRDGLAGGEAFLGSRHSVNRVLCQVPGPAYVGGVGRILAEAGNGPLAVLALRYWHTLLTQASRGVLCNRAHQVEQRAARWLLMVHDRVGEDAFALTHDFLATMLGVHRPTVSLAAGALQEAGHIRYERGVIEILDRSGLIETACECYEAIVTDYEATMGFALA